MLWVHLKVSYEAPTFNDKLPFYQQLSPGKFGQLVYSEGNGRT